MKQIINSIKSEDFLSVLPTASRQMLLKQNLGEIELIELTKFLASEPSRGMATKGGSNWSPDLLNEVIKEIRLLLCTNDTKYDEFRKKVKEQASPTAKIVVILISNAISANIGFAAGILVPLIAIIFAVASKVTVEAWCSKIDKEFNSAQNNAT